MNGGRPGIDRIEVVEVRGQTGPPGPTGPTGPAGADEVWVGPDDPYTVDPTTTVELWYKPGVP